MGLAELAETAPAQFEDTGRSRTTGQEDNGTRWGASRTHPSGDDLHPAEGDVVRAAVAGRRLQPALQHPRHDDEEEEEDGGDEVREEEPLEEEEVGRHAGAEVALDRLDRAAPQLQRVAHLGSVVVETLQRLQRNATREQRVTAATTPWDSDRDHQTFLTGAGFMNRRSSGKLTYRL